MTPIIPIPGLLPYQVEWLNEPSRLKIGLWARQTGKDFTCTAEAVTDCMYKPKTTWLILATGERQALESLQKARDWVEFFKGDTGGCTKLISRGAGNQIQWANGSRLIALPAKPETIRGYSANLILTEFAFHENADQIWRAIYPSISNPLRGGPKKLRIISTPNGLNNKFADLWHNAPGYYKSQITVHDAIAAGLPLNASELQEGINDDEAWNQEYLCAFADNSTVLLSHDLIAAAESDQATETSSHYALSTRTGQLFAGIDFGRKNHLTVCWILERLPASSLINTQLQLGDRSSDQPPNRFNGFAEHSSNLHSPFRNLQFLTREVLTLRNTSTPQQLELLLPHLRLCHRICLDYTGPGIGLGDSLAREFAVCCPRFSVSPPLSIPSPLPRLHAKLELCHFTSALKNELFPRLRTAFEKSELLVPISRDIREDLHSIRCVVGPSGQVSYRAHSTPDGHSDRCTALALALRAAQSAPLPAIPTIVRNPRPCRPFVPSRRLGRFFLA